MHDLAAAYAVDALDADERALFEAHLLDCAPCRAEVARFSEVAADLSEDIETPPPGLRGRLLDAVATTPQVGRDAAQVTVLADHPRRLGLQLLVAALALAVVAMGINVAQLRDELDRASTVRQVLSAPDARVLEIDGEAASSARLVYSEARGRAVFVADDVDAIATDQTYQLWVIDEAGPASAGLFAPVDGAVTAAIEGDFSDAVAFGVTVEPAGGSDQPTGDVILVGEF